MWTISSSSSGANRARSSSTTGRRWVRADVTMPMVRVSTGSTSGIARSPGGQRLRDHPRLGRDAGDAAAGVGEHGRHRVRLDDRLGHGAGRGEGAVDDAAVLHVGRQQAQRQRRRLGPADRGAVAELAVGGGEQQVALPPQRAHVDVGERLVVQVGEAGVELAVGEPVRDLARRHRVQRHAHARVVLAEARGDERRGRQRGGDGAEAERADEALAQPRDLLLEAAQVVDGPLRPRQHPLALGRQALEPPPAHDQRHAQLALQAADRLRQRRLRHVARRRGTSEVPLPVERDEILELAREHAAYRRPPI